eukprot:4642316-Prymnesium_polylepis.3
MLRLHTRAESVNVCVRRTGYTQCFTPTCPCAVCCVCPQIRKCIDTLTGTQEGRHGAPSGRAGAYPLAAS